MTVHRPKPKSIASRLLIFVMGSALLPIHCASVSRYFHEQAMRGSIVEANDTEVVICIGSRDGAREGQRFVAYNIIAHPASFENTVEYRRHRTGIVKIEEIIDEHFARAKIISGIVTEHDIVELDESAER